MKNVTFLIHMLGVGGAERVAAVLCNELAKENDYKVNIVRYSDDHAEYDIDPNIEVYTLPAHNNRIIRVLMRFIYFVKIVKNTKTDTLVMLAIGNSFTYWIHKLCGVRLVLSQRNDPVSEYENNPKKGKLAKRYFTDADQVVFQTYDEQNYFDKKIVEHSKVIMNPIKKDLPDVYCGERKKVVVNFCRLEKQKNLQLLIEGFIEFHKIYSDFKLKIYGEGSEKEKLLKIIFDKNASEYIEILPFCKDIHERIKDSYMFVSSSDYEGISNSMIEAMALGIPTICTDCPAGGAKMLIKDYYNGLLVPVNNQLALIDAMTKLASDLELAKKISNNGIKIREELSVEKITKQWTEII